MFRLVIRASLALILASMAAVIAAGCLWAGMRAIARIRALLRVRHHMPAVE